MHSSSLPVIKKVSCSIIKCSQTEQKILQILAMVVFSQRLAPPSAANAFGIINFKLTGCGTSVALFLPSHILKLEAHQTCSEVQVIQVVEGEVQRKLHQRRAKICCFLLQCSAWTMLAVPMTTFVKQNLLVTKKKNKQPRTRHSCLAVSIEDGSLIRKWLLSCQMGTLKVIGFYPIGTQDQRIHAQCTDCCQLSSSLWIFSQGYFHEARGRPQCIKYSLHMGTFKTFYLNSLSK